MLQFLPLIASFVGKMAANRGQAQGANEQMGIQKASLANRDQLNRDMFATKAPTERLQSAIRGSLASNFQPARWNWGGPGSGLQGKIPHMTGGISGGMANLNDATKKLGGRVSEDQLLAQMEGGASGGRKDSRMVPYPEVGKSSAFDKFLGVAGPASGFLGLLSQFKKPRTQTFNEGDGSGWMGEA